MPSILFCWKINIIHLNCCQFKKKKKKKARLLCFIINYEDYKMLYLASCCRCILVCITVTLCWAHGHILRRLGLQLTLSLTRGTVRWGTNHRAQRCAQATAMWNLQTAGSKAGDPLLTQYPPPDYPRETERGRKWHLTIKPTAIYPLMEVAWAMLALQTLLYVHHFGKG